MVSGEAARNSGPEAYPVRDVEGNERWRTKPEDIFNSLN
jgi:hypothetical protein